MSNGHACDDCRYYNGLMGSHGECRRHSPLFTKHDFRHGRFPRVEYDGPACGDFASSYESDDDNERYLVRNMGPCRVCGYDPTRESFWGGPTGPKDGHGPGFECLETYDGFEGKCIRCFRCNGYAHGKDIVDAIHGWSEGHMHYLHGDEYETAKRMCRYPDAVLTCDEEVR